MVLKQKLLKIYKRAGETPLQAVARIREKFPDFSADKMTYAGRLDPLAEGVLLILIGEECKNKQEYLGLDKEYEVEFLLGVKTDTGDVMGVIEAGLDERGFSEGQVFQAVNSLVGKKNQAYPKFSSPVLCGKEEIFKEVEIKSIEFLGQNQINSPDLLKNIIQKLAIVNGDFRQKEIIERWRKYLVSDSQFTLVKSRVVCASGTYIRVLADELGKKLETVACVYNLKRTKVGGIREGDCLRF